MEYFVYHFQVFLLVMTRMSAMITVAPFYSSGVITFRMKAVLAFLITIVIFPMVAARGYNQVPGGMGPYAVLVLQEVAVGIFIGFLVSVMFSAYQLAGQLYSVQMGFGMSEVLDPLSQISVPLVGQFKNMIGILVFLLISGHHLLIDAVYRSYELAPLMSYTRASTGGLLKYMLYAFSGMFVVALKIALPILGTLFLLSVSMGMLAKAAPQMNIMMLGLPFQIAVALGVLILVTPLTIRIMQVSLERTFYFLMQVLRHWPG